MALTTIKLVLTGGREGMTGVIDRRWPAKKGIITLTGEPERLASTVRYLGRCYKAFPEGSDELAAYQERLRHGNSKVQAHPQPGPAVKVQSDSKPEQSGSAPLPSDDWEGAEGAAAPGAGGVAVGDGHPDPGYDYKNDPGEAIRQALSQLDPNDDGVWTVDGLPRVDVVAALMHWPDLSRRLMNEHAPGVVRPDHG